MVSAEVSESGDRVAVTVLSMDASAAASLSSQPVEDGSRVWAPFHDGNHSLECIWSRDYSREDAVVWRHRGRAFGLAPRWPGMPAPLLGAHQDTLDHLAATGVHALYRLAEPENAKFAALSSTPADMPPGVGPGMDYEASLLDFPLQDLHSAAVVSRQRAGLLLQSDPRAAAEYAAMLAVAFPEATGPALVLLSEAHRTQGHFGLSVLMQAAMIRWNPESAVGFVNIATNILGPVRDSSRASVVLSAASMLMRAGLSRGEGSGSPTSVDAAVSAAPMAVRQQLAVMHRQLGPGTGWNSLRSPVADERVLLNKDGSLCSPQKAAQCDTVSLPIDAADGPAALTRCAVLAERDWHAATEAERTACSTRSEREDLWDEAIDELPHSFAPGDWLWVMPMPGGVRRLRDVGQGHTREAGDMRAALRAPARADAAAAAPEAEPQCDWHRCTDEGRRLLELQQRALPVLTGTTTRLATEDRDSVQLETVDTPRELATLLEQAGNGTLDRVGAAIVALAVIQAPVVMSHSRVCPWQVAADALDAASSPAGAAPGSAPSQAGSSCTASVARLRKRHPLIAELERHTAALAGVAGRLARVLRPATSQRVLQAAASHQQECECASNDHASETTTLAGALTHATRVLGGSAGSKQLLHAWLGRLSQLCVVRSGEGDHEASLWHSAQSLALSGSACSALTATTAMNQVIAGSRLGRLASRLKIAAVTSALLRLRLAQDAAATLGDAALHQAQMIDATGSLFSAVERDAARSLLARIDKSHLSLCEEERHFFLSYHGRGSGTALILQGFSAVVAPAWPKVAEHASRLSALQQSASASRPRRSGSPSRELIEGLSGMSVTALRAVHAQCALRPSVARRHLAGYQALLGIGLRSAVLPPGASAAILETRRSGTHRLNVRVAASGDLHDEYGNFSIGSGSVWWGAQSPVVTAPCTASSAAASLCRDPSDAHPAYILSARGVTGDYLLEGADIFDGSDAAGAAGLRAWMPLPRPLSTAEQAALAAGVDPCLASGLRRARIGFLSRHFVNEHPHGHVLRAAIAGLHRSAFEVILVRLGQNENLLDREVMAAADGVVDIRRIRSDNTLSAVQSLGLDALVFSEQLADPVAFAAGAHRSAPLQVVFGGDPTTSGHDNAVDFYVGGDRTEGDGADAATARAGMPTGTAIYTEQLLRLRGQGFSYSPAPQPAPPSRYRNYSEYDLPAGGGDGVTTPVLIGCLQSAFKMSTLLDDIMSAVLRALPMARIVTIAGRQQPWQARLEARWRRVMPDVVDRILVSPRTSPGPAFMGLLSCMDVVMHPAPFGGSRTAADTLAVGVPLVALPSRFVTGRMARSLLVSMRATGLLAHSPTHMVRLLIKLASDPPLRSGVSAELVRRAPLVWEREEVPLRWQLFLQTALHTPIADRRATRRALEAVQKQDRDAARAADQQGNGWLSTRLRVSEHVAATGAEGRVWGGAVSARLAAEAALFAAGAPVEAPWEL